VIAMLPVGLLMVVWLWFRFWFHVLSLQMWRFSIVFLCFCLLRVAAGPVCCILCHVYCNPVHTRHITKTPLNRQHNPVHKWHISNSIRPVHSATKNLITYYSNLNMTYRALNMLHWRDNLLL